MIVSTFVALGMGLSLSAGAALQPGEAAAPTPVAGEGTPTGPVATPETSPTETSPTETSPTETSPTETSPTETSPTGVPTAPVEPVEPIESAAVETAETTQPEPAPTQPTATETETAGPPYYTDADMAELRERYGLDPSPAKEARKVRWRCLVADPTCSFNVEVNATSAYAYRVQQGSPSSEAAYQWSSGRSQYDVWVNLPGVVETRGKHRYTKLSIGPKGGVIVSDTKTLWGNAGLAMRYWFGRGRWSPTIEVSSALTFRLTSADMDQGGQISTRRSPIGVTADVGFGLGGFGALIIGGQYDSPLAREDVTETARIYPGGMFFVGFRGNIVWGAPAAAAVGTTALSQRVTSPVRQ